VPRPTTVEPDEFRTVRSKDVGGDLALGALLREHHHDEFARPNVFDVVLEALVLLGLRRGSQQRSLELRKKSVLGARWIQPM
jgi:hypothetical protein